MLFLVFAAQLLSILCIMLHYSQHFKCKKKYHSNQHNHPTSPVSTPNIKRCKPCWFSCFQSVDGEEFDLFPISFLLYLVFMLIVYTLVLTKEYYLDYYNNDHSIYHTLHYPQNPLIIAINVQNIPSHRTQIHTENYKYASVMDWIICYSVIVLSIIESLFNFHRYFVTNYTSKHFFNPERVTILKTFSIYTVIYMFIFVSQIHFCYWLFPLVIGLHCTFNIYCTWMFCAVLIERYRFFSKVEKGLRSIHEELLSTVYIIRRASIVSALFSSLYVSIFCIVYDVDIVIYIPLLWSASNISFLFNFARNRVWMERTLYLCINCVRTQDVKAQVIVSTTPSLKHTKIKVTTVECKEMDVNGRKNSQNSTLNISSPISENDLSPRTVTKISITPHDHDSTPKSTISNTITPPFILKTSQKTASPRLLTIPAPKDSENAKDSENQCTEAETSATDENDTEYQKWYLNRKSLLTPTTPNIKTHDQQNSLSISSLRISLANTASNTKRKLKLFDVLGIDKTPLTDDALHKDIPLAYDMAPMNVAIDVDKALEDMSDLDDEPSVQSLPDNNENKRSQTPSSHMFLGMILKRAASLITLHGSDMDEAKYPTTKLQSRPRSSSDPTTVKNNDDSPVLSVKPNAKYGTHLAKESLALDIHQISNRSAPATDGDTYRYKCSGNIMSHSMSFLHGADKNKASNHLKLNIGSKAETERTADIGQLRANNDVFLSVLVSHGFYSQSSVNDAKQLRLYLQDK